MGMFWLLAVARSVEEIPRFEDLFPDTMTHGRLFPIEFPPEWVAKWPRSRLIDKFLPHELVLHEWYDPMLELRFSRWWGAVTFDLPNGTYLRVPALFDTGGARDISATRRTVKLLDSAGLLTKSASSWRWERAKRGSVWDLKLNGKPIFVSNSNQKMLGDRPHRFNLIDGRVIVALGGLSCNEKGAFFPNANKHLVLSHVTALGDEL
jgi:hypothetical protein